MSNNVECKSLLESFYWDEMYGHKKFTIRCIAHFILFNRYQALVLIRWQRIWYLRYKKFSSKRGWIFRIAGKTSRYLEILTHRINFSSNGGINYTSTANVGKYLFITNPMGISIAGDCIIGDHLEIHRGVNIGEKNGKYPRIGNHVYIGSGAHLLGNITVGDQAKIGAMSLVIKDVGEGSVVAGIPAKIIKTSNVEK